jgi:hypothetical protein
MSPTRGEIIRRSSRWVTTFGMIAFVPKCVACVVAYLGLVTGFGFGSAEICGAAPGFTASWGIGYESAAVALGVVGWLLFGRLKPLSEQCEVEPDVRSR